MTKCKFFYIALGTVGLLLAGATTFRLVTGQCPVGAFCEYLHGSKAPATAPAAAN
jgi:hypothetical protein